MSDFTIKPFETFKIDQYIDSRGNLAAIDDSIFPNNFQFKRLFWIHNVPSAEKRGNHGHFESNQILISLTDLVTCVYKRNNSNSISVNLMPGHGIFLPKLTWVSLEFANERSVLLVLTDNYYSSEDVFTSFGEL